MIPLAGILASILSTACVAVEGDRITAREAARAIPELASLPGDVVLGYAPVPGVRRLMSVRDLERFAVRQGIQLQNARPLCFERSAEMLTAERISAALRLPESPSARIEVVDFSRYPVPRGELYFPRASLACPGAPRPVGPVLWRGYVRYGELSKYSVWARVRIGAAFTRVVAAQDLPAGRPISGEQIRVETFEGCPPIGQPLADTEGILGRVPRRSLRAGAVIEPANLDLPIEVRRGDMVAVEVESGSARLELTATAESAGRRGEAILLRNAQSGRSFTGRVAGNGRALVNAEIRGEHREPASGAHE